MRANKSIDTDALSAGFAGLLSAGHLQRYTCSRGTAAPSVRVCHGSCIVSSWQPLDRDAVNIVRQTSSQWTTAGLGAVFTERPSRTLRPERAGRPSV